MEKTLQCQACKTNNYEDANFCAMCGAPITANATILNKQRKASTQLELLNAITDEIEDIETIKTLRAYAQKLSK
jgi:uncharacterized membrane protein YvbJ